MAHFKQTLKTFIPSPVLSAWYGFHAKKRRDELARCNSPEETFATIYRRGHWGRSGDQSDQFYSGLGSRDSKIVQPYVQAVELFLKRHNVPLDAADLGCGDFFVGAQIRAYCGRYHACDVVEDVIDQHKVKYADRGVIFQAMDITRDDLPPADVVFIRQVLQHLSNEDIKRVVPKLYRYKYLVVTEDVPASADFVPNLDKSRGMDTRLGLGTNGSGVVLTAPPFDLRVKNAAVLCEVEGAIGGAPGVIQTTLYEL